MRENIRLNHGFEGLKDCTDSLQKNISKASAPSVSSVEIQDYCQYNGFMGLKDCTDSLQKNISKASAPSVSSGEIEDYCQYNGFMGLKDCADSASLKSTNRKTSVKSVPSVSSVEIRDSDNWQAPIHPSKTRN